MKQADLIARITKVLSGLERIGGAFLGGSFGRGEADDYSDVDVFVVVANAEDIPIVVTELANNLGMVSPILFSNVLPNGRTINSITMDWLRFDLTIVSRAELVHFAQERLEPLFDRLAVLETLPVTSEQRPHSTPDALLGIINEFIRVLGLSVVVKGRDDLVVAQTGANLLRDMLIRIMVLENGPQPQRGVLALKRTLTQGQIATLNSLPPLEATWSSIHGRTKVMAEQFLPRARALAEGLGAAWPQEFERVTLAHLQEELGLKIQADASGLASPES
jgi:predicted nucleotidyltransferase